MNLTALISSGILENYCLGFCTEEETRQIEAAAAMDPAVKNEINSIQASFENYFLSNEIKPSTSVKATVLQAIYRQESFNNDLFAPFIDKDISIPELKNWITRKNIQPPTADFDNLFIIELPSTGQVTNFFVFAKQGHEEEMHTDFIEYLYIIEGSCTMDFSGEQSSYSAGDIIAIMPHIKHTAVVTSPLPMWALVQRQACA